MNNNRTLFPPLFGEIPTGGGGGGSGNKIQLEELPEASLEYKDRIVQYIGTTTETLTNGYFYKCVEHTTTEGDTITVTYSWDNVDVMEAPETPLPFGSFKSMEIDVTTTANLTTSPTIADMSNKIFIDFIGTCIRDEQGFSPTQQGYCYKGANNWSWNVYQDSSGSLKAYTSLTNAYPAGCKIKGIILYLDKPT